MLNHLRRSLAAALACLMLLVCTACETVETTVLIGERATELPADWTGSWQIADTIVHLHVEGGTLHAAGVEWEDGEFKLQQIAAIVTALGEHRFLHIETEPDEDEDNEANEVEDGAERETTYAFMMIEQPEKDALVVAISDPFAFREAVELGKLSGEIIRDPPSLLHPKGKPNTTILRDKKSLDDFIRSASIDELFTREEPLKLKRIVLVVDEDDAEAE